MTDPLMRRCRAVPLSNPALEDTRRMRDDWRDGISLTPSQPAYSRGSGRKLVWDDEPASASGHE